MILPLLFVIGFATWFIVFLRSFALDSRRTAWLAGLVFADEALGIGTGVWLARNGGLLEIAAVAAGGTLAATVVVRLFRRRDEIHSRLQMRSGVVSEGKRGEMSGLWFGPVGGK